MLLRNAALGFVAATAFAASACAATSTAPTLDLEADGEIQIATDGHVSDYQLKTPLGADLSKLIASAVRGWRFEPVVVDGQAVVATTTMHLELHAEPADVADSYRIRVSQVRFGEPKRDGHMRPPKYPTSAVSARLGARVMLAVRLDENGKIVEAMPYQTSLDARTSSEAEAERWRKQFEQASIVAARSWHWDLTEKVNGKTVGTSAIVPVVFSIIGTGREVRPGKWKAYVPGPVHDVPWLQDAHADEKQLAAIGDDGALSLDSHFRLKDDVVGKAL